MMRARNLPTNDEELGIYDRDRRIQLQCTLLFRPQENTARPKKTILDVRNWCSLFWFCIELELQVPEV